MSGMEAPATCPTERVTAWPAKGGRVGYCPWCGRSFHTTNRSAMNLTLPAHAAPADPSCNFCGKPTALDGHGRYVEHQGITTRGICCGTALLHVPGRKVARR